MLLQGVIKWREAGIYSVTQVSGAIGGIVLAHLMFEMQPLGLSNHVRTGFAVWLSEGVSTFGLVFTILVSGRYRPQSNPAIVAAYLLSATLFTSTSFANPAITIARVMTDTIPGIRPHGVPAFMFTQLIGGLLAVLANRWLSSGTRHDSA